MVAWELRKDSTQAFTISFHTSYDRMSQIIVPFVPESPLCFPFLSDYLLFLLSLLLPQPFFSLLLPQPFFSLLLLLPQPFFSLLLPQPFFSLLLPQPFFSPFFPLSLFRTLFVLARASVFARPNYYCLPRFPYLLHHLLPAGSPVRTR